MNTTLPAEAFTRADETPDRQFYAHPRLVTHIDDAAVAAVTQLYRELFPQDGAGRVLDLMSSWVSHLPPEIEYVRVAGLGMNAEELDANPRLTERRVQDLNADTALPYEHASFDGCGICVSVQYLTRPVEVFREVGRVLAPGAPVVITFSNRCFPTKAVRGWLSVPEDQRPGIVADYHRLAGGFAEPVTEQRLAATWRHDPLWAVWARRA